MIKKESLKQKYYFSLNKTSQQRRILKRIVLSVINDLTTDQRLHRVCTTLNSMGFDVLLVGRKKRDSMPLDNRDYKMKRMRLLFEKGPLFYAEYNFRLFLFLLFSKTDFLISNDLDTLLANFLASKIKGKTLFYDTHEYYTETPELVNRKRVQRIWESIEKWIFPNLKYVYTVNDSIAGLYRKKYGVPVEVIRNVPFRKKYEIKKSRKELGLPENKKIILLQGAGINIQRGAEEMLEAMKQIDNAVFVILGGGDVIDILKEIANKSKLEDKVMFIPKQPMNKVYQYTVHADLGISLDKDTNLNYRFSLPNKIFDYIQARVPVLASPLIEIEKVIKDYNIGTVIENHDPENIAKKVSEIFDNSKKLSIWKENLTFASEELCWEKEEEKLIKIYKSFV